MRRRPSIAYGGIARLARAERRTTLLRFGIGGCLLALLLTQVRVADRSDPVARRLDPPGTSTVLVVDLSYSIFAGTYRTIANSLNRLAAQNRPVGLVVFSDTSYVLLPPGSPSRELKPVARYFTPLNPDAPDDRQQFPTNPWSAGFRAGTRISDGLLTAYSALLRAGVPHKRILLLSDLDAPDQDLERLTDAVGTIERHGVDLKALPLFATPGDRAFFARLAGKDVFVDGAHLSGRVHARAGALSADALPWLFLGLGALLALVLAANETFCARVEVPA